VFFGYTQCPDVCPTTLSTLVETMKLLGPDADRVQVVFITVDPERDTQA
jgi:protein SCO1/2